MTLGTIAIAARFLEALVINADDECDPAAILRDLLPKLRGLREQISALIVEAEAAQ